MINRIEIDGLDKTGKDLIAGYVDRLSNRRYVVHSRGLLSMVAYNDRYGRGYNYEQEMSNNYDTLFVYLCAEKEDLEIRHKLSNEPPIDMDKDMLAFVQTVREFQKHNLKVLSFNTSAITPYEVAKRIIEYVEKENRK